MNYRFYILKNKLFLHLILVLALVSCGTDIKQKAAGTYLGGEIINPFSDHVLLIRNNVVVDSIKLDANNRFLHEFTNFQPGVYRFSHGEHQLVHIEEGDSIMLRVNTVEFDESLSFSGLGAAKNNFLIDLYLHYEKENVGMTKKYQRNPQDFQLFLDSIQKVREKLYNRFLEKNDVSQSFQEVAQASIDYDNYHRKEAYPFSHYGKDKLGFIKSLPEDFYRFRESVNLNNPNLSELYAFQRYTWRYFNHLAYLKYGKKQPYNTVSYAHNRNRLYIIDSLVTHPNYRESLLRRSVEIFIANNNNVRETKGIYDLSNSLAANTKLKEEIVDLYNSNEKMHVGQTIPDQIIIDVEGRLTSLRDIIKGPTVLYFWSYDRHAHLENSHKKIKDLSSKYPEYSFVGINLDDDAERWQASIKMHQFSKTHEFQFYKPAKARKELVINAQGKAIVLDKNAQILTSHGNLYRVQFEQELLAFLNK